MYKFLMTRILHEMNSTQKIAFLLDAMACIGEVDGELYCTALDKAAMKIHEEFWMAEARAFYADNARVAGIRVCRAATGWGLKDAKEYCDQNFPIGENHG